MYRTGGSARAPRTPRATRRTTGTSSFTSARRAATSAPSLTRVLWARRDAGFGTDARSKFWRFSGRGVDIGKKWIEVVKGVKLTITEKFAVNQTEHLIVVDQKCLEVIRFFRMK